MDPSLIPEFNKITIVIMGEQEPFISFFSVLFYICIFLAIASWFVGLIIELIKIIAALVIAFTIIAPFSSFDLSVHFSTFTLSISLLLTIFFWLFITIRVINISLDLFRYKSEVSLDKEYKKKEVEEPRLHEKKPITTSIIKRILKEPYEYSWLDSEYETPKIDDDDEFVSKNNWKAQRTKYITSNREKLHNLRVLYFYLSIYALIVFFFVDGMKFPIDNTFRVLTLPLMIYFILGFRSFMKLLKSAVVTGVIGGLMIFLIPSGIITANGIFFLYYAYLFLYIIYLIQLLFINPPEFINGIVNGFVSPLDVTDPLVAGKMMGAVFGPFYTISGILCVFVQLAIWFFIIHRKKSSVVISEKNLFIRDKTRTSRINDVRIGLMLLLNPASPKNYRNALKKMQYNRLVAIEGGEYDYGKMPFDGLLRVKVKKAVPLYNLLIIEIWILGSILLFFIAAFNGDILDMAQYVLFFLIAFIPLSTERKKRDLKDIQIRFDRSRVRGSWVYGHTYTTIKFKDITSEFAEAILQRCDPSIIDEKWTLRKRKEIEKLSKVD